MFQENFRLELFQKSILMKNIVFFVVLSPFFLHILRSIEGGYSAFELKELVTFVWSYLWLFGFALVLSKFVLAAKPISKVFYATYSFIIIGLSFFTFWGDFSKFLLILIFLYTLSSFLFFLLWKLELNEPYLRPNFDINQIGKKALTEIKCTLKMQEVVYEGYLTNWDMLGCFMYLNTPVTELYQKAILKVEFEGRVFSEECTIVSKYENAVGLRFPSGYRKKMFGHEWSDFYAIIAHRGYVPV